MGDEKPLDLDDDEPRPKKKRPPAELPSIPAHLVTAGFFGVAKWLLLGLGALFVVVALNQAAPWAAAFSGIACFVAIAARIAQAEEHYHKSR